MKIFKFFEFIARMGQIVRWSLMRNIRQEDLKQHSFDVAVLAHALATIRNVYFADFPEVKYFMENFMSDRPMSLDELIEGNGSWLLEGGLE